MNENEIDYEDQFFLAYLAGWRTGAPSFDRTPDATIWRFCVEYLKSP